MTGEERRDSIITNLRIAQKPLSASSLAKEFGVSRQVIVQDIALLRANGSEIYATNRGYLLMSKSSRPQRVFKVFHTEEQTREEMQCIVDLGGRIEDIFIFHRVYGVVRGDLHIASRKDVDDFMKLMAGSESRPLSDATSGYHYHTVSAEQESTLDLIFEELGNRGFLAGLQDYEPVNFWETK
ncbi:MULTISPECIES: transcription repressor NadR [Agathobacter]|uniref:DNA-binding transcriptional regulator n=1 Tax=Agathobacter ruminis TaxID=1712665 RepID=A0A2G3DZY8_9FIRM|nr:MULTISPECIES: transcription repressor NadR [Agathobacter]MBQ1682547.1 transcription repressor NadR [Agathobacter sp.]MDC7302769.1 transcription repressor NadR [Agathobacter ruminis]PHU36443.1 DNA-binding transcriptional regulator [Agathobacter ruminis]